MSITQKCLQLWDELSQHQQSFAQCHLRQLLQEPQRKQRFSLHAAGLLLDFSRNHINEQTLDLLCQLAEAKQLPNKITGLFQGAHVNSSEQRPALHTALRCRSTMPVFVDGKDVMPGIRHNLARMELFVQQLHQQQWLGYSQQPITDIVNIGIGGSHLGPALAVKALRPFHNSKLRLHFVANIDGDVISHTLNPLNPATTLFIISSKSFTTVETLTNAETALQWFQQATPHVSDRAKHFITVTNNLAKAIAFGMPEETIFPLADWVGGRYSLWSAIGLPVALAIGMQHFRELLDGAYAMDQHFLQQPLQQNMPVILGLINVWYINFFATNARAVLPYSDLLSLLPAYLQQLEMESTGKSVTNDGKPVTCATGQILFGEVGTLGQHAFYQLLHQGTQLIPTDFIVPQQAQHNLANHQAILVANAFGHSKALAEGLTLEEAIEELQQQNLAPEAVQKLAPHKVLVGNKPSNLLLFEKLTPFTLGALLALYEHKVFVQSTIWDINPFDQWGVELGKKITLHLQQ